jgi:hypothetical protein
MASNAAENVLRKLARRLMEAQLKSLKAELQALCGEPQERPPVYISPLPTLQETPKATPRLSELARQ